MATFSWNTTYGVWTNAANWSPATVPGPGDTAVINFGNAEPDLTGQGTLFGATIDVVAGFKLDIGGSVTPSVFDASSVVTFANPGLFALADFGYLINVGTMAKTAAGELDLYLIPGGTISSSFFNIGTLDISAGAMKVMGFGDFMSQGLIEVRNTGGQPGVGLTVLSPTQSLINNGTLSIDGLTSAARSSTGATLGPLTGTGTVNLANATLTIRGDLDAGQTIHFLDGKGTMALDLTSHTAAATITGFRPGDVIDLGAIAADAVSYDTGTLTITNGGGTVGTLQIAGAYATGDFALSNDGTHELLSTTAIPCFAAGTRIATPDGMVPVETLRAGDMVLSHFGGAVPVRWVGSRRARAAGMADPGRVWPIRIEAGALGPGVPCAPLFVSADHALYLDGVLVPAGLLVNGMSIRPEMRAEVTYHHVELAQHDVLLAEGAGCESYLDVGNRGDFDGVARPLVPVGETADEVWRARACAPQCRGGARLAALRGRLARRALGVRRQEVSQGGGEGVSLG